MPIDATCSKCGRKFAFQPETVKESCQICGGKVVLPADYVKPVLAARGGPSVIRVDCPVCGRPKELDASAGGKKQLCWFCQAPLVAPVGGGLAPLDTREESPATAAVPPAPYGARPENKLAYEILPKRLKAGTLGSESLSWMTHQFQKLEVWQKTGGSIRSPFDMRFTGVILATGLFRAHAVTEASDGAGLLRLTFELESRTTGSLGNTVMATMAIAAAFGGTFVFIRPGASEETRVALFMDIDLAEVGVETEIQYSLRSSEGGVKSAKKVLGKEWESKFPSNFAKAAGLMLAFKAAFGAGAPGRLMAYVTPESLQAQLERVTKDAMFSRGAAERWFAAWRS